MNPKATDVKEALESNEKRHQKIDEVLSTRGEQKTVKGLEHRFKEILEEELQIGFDISPEIERIVPRLIDAVTEVAMADPH